MIAYGYKKYRKYRNNDPIVNELKKKSPIQTFSEKGKPLKLPFVRRGDNIIRRYFLLIKSKKLSKLLRALVLAKKSKTLKIVARLLNYSQCTINY